MSFDDQYIEFIDSVAAVSQGKHKGEDAFAGSIVLMGAYRNPQNSVPAIHVAGSMGKGTITKLVTLMLAEHDKSSVAIISPHTYTPRERILQNGQNISETDFLELIGRYQADPILVDGYGMHTFRVLTLLGFLYAEKERPGYQVIETGMGGRYDATNTISRPDKVAVIGQVGLDHTDALGETLSEIAWHKAGIIHPGNSVVALRQSQAVNEVISEAAGSNEVVWVDGSGLDFDPVELNSSLAGDYQPANVELALRTVMIVAERDGWAVDGDKIKSAVARFSLPGRLEQANVDGRLVLLDTAHNQSELEGLIATIRKAHGDVDLKVVFASSARNPAKARESLEFISGEATEVIFTAYHADQISRYRPSVQADQIKGGLPEHVRWQPDHQPIVEQIRSDKSGALWLITGSTFLLPEIKPLLSGSDF